MQTLLCVVCEVFQRQLMKPARRRSVRECGTAFSVGPTLRPASSPSGPVHTTSTTSLSTVSTSHANCFVRLASKNCCRR